MTKLNLSNGSPGLLVSVRSATEALTALAGGADLIDVKEPNQGALGRADDETISSIVCAVAGRAPVSVALGELIDLVGLPNGNGSRAVVAGASLFKIGLAGCAALGEWQSRWRQAINMLLSTGSNDSAQPVAVVYADWHVAQSPAPRDVLNAAIERGCPALLVDTWDKSGGTLFDHWPARELQNFLADVRSQNIAVVLAGSLTGQSIASAVQLAPDLVAVRTAACDAGRTGTVSEKKVRELKIAMAISIRHMAVL